MFQSLHYYIIDIEKYYNPVFEFILQNYVVPL